MIPVETADENKLCYSKLEKMQQKYYLLSIFDSTLLMFFSLPGPRLMNAACIIHIVLGIVSQCKL